MSIQIKKLPKSQIKVTARPTKKQVERASQEALRKLSKEIDVPGFRRGKAPVGAVRERINETKLALETIDFLADQIFRQAISEHSFRPLHPPQVVIPNQEKLYQNLSSLDNLREFLILEYIVDIKPEIELKNYSQLQAKHPEVVVKENEVDQAINNLFSEWKGKQEASATGQESQREPEEIVTAKTLSEAEQKAKQEDEEKEAQSKKNTPDDEWAQIIGSPSLTALKTKVRDFLRGIREAETEKQFEQNIFDALLTEMGEIDLPESIVAQEMKRQETQVRQQMAGSGTSLDQVLEKQKKTLDDVRTKWRAAVEKQLRIDFILDRIAQEEKLTVGDDEVNQEIGRIKEPKVKKQFENSGPQEYIRFMLRQRKALEWVKERVVSSAG
ncbi:hypothetical protein KKB83_01805 [Patescibacteria group bacterium]|nr:hypothetical protein [Patescibacteria group bacterium]